MHTRSQVMQVCPGYGVRSDFTSFFCLLLVFLPDEHHLLLLPLAPSRNVASRFTCILTVPGTPHWGILCVSTSWFFIHFRTGGHRDSFRYPRYHDFAVTLQPTGPSVSLESIPRSGSSWLTGFAFHRVISKHISKMRDSFQRLV